MRIKKETPTIKEKREKGEGYFIYQKIPEGQIGVVKSYGKEVLQELAKIAPNIKRLPRHPEEIGWRKKYIGEIKTRTGALKFIVKKKANPREEKRYFRPWERKHTEKLFISVLHEIAINLETRARYKEKYHEDLPLEKPIGFFIAKNEDRFVINEYIENLIPIPYNDRQMLVFMDRTKKRLKELDILPDDLVPRNILCQKVGRKKKFWVIDTEMWEKGDYEG